MPALVAGIHDFKPSSNKDVDGRDKPGHDGGCSPRTLPMVIPEAAKRLSGIQPRAPSLPLDSGLAAEPAPGRREAPIRVRRPGMTAH